MKKQQFFKFLFWVSLAVFSHGYGRAVGGLDAKCRANGPTVQQSQVGKGNPPKYKVEVYNRCPMCPVINIHLKCGSFPQSLVNPKLFKVLAFDDCVINQGLPLAPLQTFSFNYSHYPMFTLHPATWFFQCE